MPGWKSVVVCALAVFAAFAQPPQTKLYKISGIVIDAAGEPLGKTTVRISLLNVQRPYGATMTTAADGYFHFDGVPPGKYNLVASRRGFPQQSLDEHFGFSTAVAAGPDLPSEDILFRMHRDASISGQVTDDQNESVPDAEVLLFCSGTETGRAATTLKTRIRTDDHGAYRFRHQAPGKYLIAVSAHPWYAQHPVPPGSAALLDVVYPLTFDGGATDEGLAAPIDLSWGDSATANVTLQTIPALRVRVRTAAADAKPEERPAGSSVTFFRQIFGNELLVHVPMIGVRDGVLEAAGVPPGRYQLNVQTPGPTPAASRRGIDTAAGTEIDVTKGAHELLRVSGTVEFDKATLTRPGGQLYITLSDPHANQSRGADVSPGGQFEFGDVYPGKYEVGLQGMSDIYLKSLKGSGTRVDGRKIEIGSEAVKLNITVGQGLGHLDGVALTEGKPRGGARVVLVPENRIETDYRLDQSDSDGTFTLGTIPPGDYFLIALQNWDVPWQDPEVLRRVTLRGERVRIASGGKYNVKVEIQ
jgi:hypothetical protein